MLPLASVLLSPFRALLWIFRRVHEAADDDRAAQRERLLQSLAELHQQLERGEVSEPQFDIREAALLQQLERLQIDCSHSRSSG